MAKSKPQSRDTPIQIPWVYLDAIMWYAGAGRYSGLSVTEALALRTHDSHCAALSATTTLSDSSTISTAVSASNAPVHENCSLLSSEADDLNVDASVSCMRPTPMNHDCYNFTTPELTDTEYMSRFTTIVHDSDESTSFTKYT